MQPPDPTRKRFLAFTLFVIACVAVAATYVTLTLRQQRALDSATSISAVVDEGAKRRAIQAGPHLVFQHTGRDEHYAKIAVAPLADPSSARAFTEVTCERVSVASGRGLCLVPEYGVVNHFYAYRLNAELEPTTRVELGGSPSRTRLTPNGRFGATTIFVAGHGYADNAFSTQTNIIDMTSGTVVADLESFTVIRDGEPFKKRDFNFWGVTFKHDNNGFFATLRTAGRVYLVEGDLAARRMTLGRENIECPSLSPDNTRLAFKKPLGRPGSWRLSVLDLASGKEVELAETHSIDDQAEWLDDSHVLYGLNADLWVIAADGSGRAQKFLTNALSPTVVRQPVGG